METELLKGEPKFERLGKYYVVALCAIALSIIFSQFIAQKYLREQKDDSHLVNLAGRQRMLSQQISKYALSLARSTDASQREATVRGFKGALEEWKKAHATLRSDYGDSSKIRKRDRRVHELLGKVESSYKEMATGADQLLTQLEQNPMPPFDSITKNIDRILSYEAQYLEDMNKVVLQFDQNAQTKIDHLKNIQLFLFVISLIVILFSIFGIFLPSVREIKRLFKKYTVSEAKAKKIALETSALYTSLEQAYQDLLEAEATEEEYTVYGKCDSRGNFTYFSDTFLQLMEFEGEKPNNLYDWLENQGYDRTYLDNINSMALSGQPWNGEIKVVNTAGDFIWLNFHIVPILDTNQVVESLTIICTNETEKKEAEAISREINKEKIDQKVKEQQFRSALILEGQEEERKRISREMHDGVGQLLSAMKFNIEAIQSVNSDFEREKLRTLKTLLKKVIMEVRRISFNLTPSALSDYGIVPVLNKFCREVSKISDLQVNFENRTGFISRLEGKVENNLYRIVQEAVNNAIKYAEAKEVNVIISHNSRYLHLDIIDNGKGFDIQKLTEKGHFSASGHGIFNIKERANFIAAQCTITSEIGKGTTISISVPLN
jgi:two-component system sensor histidine kinase DegS